MVRAANKPRPYSNNLIKDVIRIFGNVFNVTSNNKNIPSLNNNDSVDNDKDHDNEEADGERQRLLSEFKFKMKERGIARFTSLIFEMSFLIANLMFFIGSFCFFSWQSEAIAKIGVRLFIIGSLIGCFCAGYSLNESYSYKRQRNDEKDDYEYQYENYTHMDDHTDDAMVSDKTQQQEQQVQTDNYYIDNNKYNNTEDPIHDNHEINENICFFIACLIFAIASILYEPNLISDPVTSTKAHALGSWSFIVGSILFQLGSFYACLGLSHYYSTLVTSGYAVEIALWCKSLYIWGLLCTQIGSVAFVTGSYLYRPGLEDHCSHVRGSSSSSSSSSSSNNNNSSSSGSVPSHYSVYIDGVLVEDNIMGVDCVSSINEGTLLYVVGSALFVCQSLLNLYSCWLKQKYDVVPWSYNRGRSSSRSSSSSNCDSKYVDHDHNDQDKVAVINTTITSGSSSSDISGNGGKLHSYGSMLMA